MEPIIYAAVLLLGMLAGGFAAASLTRASRGSGLAETDTEVAELRARLAEKEIQAEASQSDHLAALQAVLTDKERSVGTLLNEIGDLKARHASLLTRLDEAAKRAADPAAGDAGGVALAVGLQASLDQVNARLAEMAAQAAAASAPEAPAPFSPPPFAIDEAVRPLRESVEMVAGKVADYLVQFDKRQRGALSALIQPLQASLSHVDGRLEELAAKVQTPAAASPEAVDEAVNRIGERLAGFEDSQKASLAKVETNLSDLAAKWQAPAPVPTEEAVRGLRESIDAVARRIGDRLSEFERCYTGSLAALVSQVQAMSRPVVPSSPALPLRRVVELAGLASYAAFGDSSATLRLPQGLQVSIDAGLGDAACLEALQSGRTEDWVGMLRARCVALAENNPGLSVVVLPSDACWLGAVQHDPGLPAEVLEYGVVLASPALLLSLLRTAAAVPVPSLSPELRSQLSAVEKQFANLRESLETHPAVPA